MKLHNLPQRKPLRIAEFDYGTAGSYSITICTEHKSCRFGEVLDGDVRLNRLGQLAEECLFET